MKKFLKKRKLNTDKILFIMLFCVLSVVILSQIGLIAESTRDAFTDVENYEGVTASGDAVKKGSVKMTLADGKPGNNLWIMVNGEKVDVFDLRTKEVLLMETSVVEVYAQNLDHDETITIDFVSDNLDNTTDIDEIRIKNGYNMIGRFMFSE